VNIIISDDHFVDACSLQLQLYNFMYLI